MSDDEKSVLEGSLYGVLNSIYCYGDEDETEICSMGFEKDIDKLIYDGELPINVILEYIFKHGHGCKYKPFNWALENIKNVDIVDKNGNNPLHIIAINLKKIGNWDKHNMAQALIKKGFNPCIKNNKGFTAIENAESVCPKFKITDWNINWNINCENCCKNVPKHKKGFYECKECDFIILERMRMPWESDSDSDSDSI